MSNNIKEDLALFNELINIFLEEEQKAPVSKYIKPEDLNKQIDIKLGKYPLEKSSFKKSLKELLLKSPKSSSKLFFNQLFGGRHSKAVLGDLLAVFINNSMATYKIAGPQVAVEKEILNQVFKLIGYGNRAGGTFPTGGSMSNFMSLVMARDKVNLDVKEKGIQAKLILYASENAHYSLAKNVSFTGIG